MTFGEPFMGDCTVMQGFYGSDHGGSPTPRDCLKAQDGRPQPEIASKSKRTPNSEITSKPTKVTLLFACLLLFLIPDTDP
jgi:hypothetical protein